MEDKVNPETVLAGIDKAWSPHVIASVNDYSVKVAHIEGEFVWHSHDDTDELFYLVSGECEIHLRDRIIQLSTGDIFVVPKGVEHKPVSVHGADILLFEPAQTTNTGTTDEDIPDFVSTTTGRTL